jgi:hypothetical protein
MEGQSEEAGYVRTREESLEANQRTNNRTEAKSTMYRSKDIC